MSYININKNKQNPQSFQQNQFRNMDPQLMRYQQLQQQQLQQQQRQYQQQLRDEQQSIKMYPQEQQMRNYNASLLQQQQLQHMKQMELQRQRQIQNQQQKIVETNSSILNQIQNINKTKEPEQPVKPKSKYQTLSSQEINNECYEIFREIYKNRVKQTKVESIINGEIITTNKDNIFVNTTTFEDPKFDDKCKLLTKKLFSYQANSIKMIRQIELSNEYVLNNGEKLVTNAILLKLPIGAGKSLVFETLAMLYRDVPPKPIIISTSGINIPEDKMTQLKFYPFYYENAGYIIDSEGNSKENCVVVMKNYVQREKLTVIITHFHLIDQLLDYFKSDFISQLFDPKITKIAVATDVRSINLDCNILIVPAKPEIIERLSILSWEMPFSRIIVDDYTNMPGIEEYRQILATSTIFVSGSGFERDIEKIPPSYYTLRHVDINKFSLVAKPEETSKGILRNNIITYNLIGAQNNFSMYKFVNDVDEQCINKYRLVASNLYSRIETNGGKLIDYFILNFILKNFDKLNKSINLIMRDIESEKLDKSKVEFLMKWKEIINDKVKVINPNYKRNIQNKGNQNVNQQNKNNQKQNQQSVNQNEFNEIENPLYNVLFKPINQIPQGIQPMLMQNCQVCGALPQEHKGWGLISCCCGAFFCSKCLKSMVTKNLIINNESRTKQKEIKDNNYYCVVCHKCNPVYVSNSTRHKDIPNIQTYHLVDEFMDNSELKGHLHVDYYFKMFIDGFKPRYYEGKTIECEVSDDKFDEAFKDNENSKNDEAQADLNNEIIDEDKIKNKIEIKDVSKIIEPLIPKDQLAVNCIGRINECLKKLEIKPAEMNTIKPQLLVYGCPDYMQKRVEQYFKYYSVSKDESLYGLSVLFKNNMSELIGLHQNIFGILVWNNPKNIDEIQQLIGRIVRLNNWNNPVYFYITCTGGINTKGEAIEDINNADNVENKQLGAHDDSINNILNSTENEDGPNMLEILKSMKFN